MVKPVTYSVFVYVMSNLHLTFSVLANNGNAFDTKINPCLFDGWRAGKNPVLATKVECGGRDRTGLCYGAKQPALFAVCFNKITLIPEFTAHVVEPALRVPGREDWRNEQGKYAPNPQSDVNDYDPFNQGAIVPHFNYQLNYFYGRGHLTPNGDFATLGERELTMVNTNIAPQWQPFNAENWATLEAAVRRYADAKKNKVFVFTGTGGTTYQRVNGQEVPMLLNQRVLVPRYFWKAICDPAIGKSVVFVAQNPKGTEDNQPVGGCSLDGVNPKLQSPRLGVLYCYSLNDLKAKKFAEEFKLPPFSNTCTPSERGKFLDQYLNGLS